VLFSEWRLRHGPDWHASLQDADPNDGTLRDTLEAAQVAFGRDPYAYTHALVEQRDTRRIFQTRDTKAGHRFTIFIEVDPPNATVWLMWIAHEGLGSDP
jgi:uncharacterized protein (DUF1684 family)